MIQTIKNFWQHANGKIYAIESNTFGRVIGVAGPLNAENLHNLEDYDYKSDITAFVVYAIAHHKLQRFYPLSANNNRH